MERNLSDDVVLSNLRTMQDPTELLKFSYTGKPKFRVFQLDPSLSYLYWESKKKSSDQTKIRLSEIHEIRFGQRTAKFDRNNRQDLSGLSFSIIYGVPGKVKGGNQYGTDGRETLDLVCKDETEFQTWAYTLHDVVRFKLTAQSLRAGSNGAKPFHAPSASRQLSAQDANTGGHVYTFGWGDWGQTCCSQTNATQSNPYLVQQLLNGVVQSAAGWSHSTFLLENGSVLQCGNRVATGLAQDYFSAQPIAIPQKKKITYVSCGSSHTVALSEDGRLYAWGCNFNGQLGLGDTVDRSEPEFVSIFSDREVVNVECGDKLTVAQDDHGHLYTWGCGDNGALGHDSLDDALYPTVVVDLQGVSIKQFAAGGNHVLACSEREVYAWGSNSCGQLGIEKSGSMSADVLRPSVVGALRGKKVLNISCGAAHSACVVFLPERGRNVLYTWGSNACGQLGQEKKTGIAKPFLVTLPESFRIVEVACGDLHTVIRDEEGLVFATGNNAFGQLGNGTKSDTEHFSLVNVFSVKDKPARSVVCGGQHTIVLTTVRERWVDDKDAKNCMQCQSGFTFTNRKHHCRNCGGIFCGSCSSKKITILSLGSADPQRVCDKCFDELQAR